MDTNVVTFFLPFYTSGNAYREVYRMAFGSISHQYFRAHPNPNKHQISHFKNFHTSSKICGTRSSGAYGPLVLAPAEGVGALWAPCQVWVIYLFILSFLSLLSFFLIFFFNLFFYFVDFFLTFFIFIFILNFVYLKKKLFNFF